MRLKEGSKRPARTAWKSFGEVRHSTIRCITEIGELPTAWHNEAEPADVDASGFVSLADILTIVGYLRENPPGPLPEIDEPPTPGYVDVTQDGMCTLADLLAAVLVLREELAAEGEAPSSHVAAVDAHFALFELRDGTVSCLWANGPPPTGCRSRVAVYEICAWWRVCRLTSG